MRIAVMQPYFFPYIGYWQLIHSVDTFVLYDDVNFIKGGWINRNRILLKDSPYFITIPLENASPWKFINEIIIDSNQKTKEKLIKTMYHAYSKAPLFHDVFPIIEQYINSSGKISDILKCSIESICEYCRIKTKIIVSSGIEKNNLLKKEYKIIEICKKLGAKEYINPIGGTGIYDKAFFNDNLISLYFLKSQPTIYSQYNNTFVSNLSIIDVMMFNSKEKIMRMLEKYELF